MAEGLERALAWEGSAAMPITPYLNGQRFDPETTRIMDSRLS